MAINKNSKKIKREIKKKEKKIIKGIRKIIIKQKWESTEIIGERELREKNNEKKKRGL